VEPSGDEYGRPVVGATTTPPSEDSAAPACVVDGAAAVDVVVDDGGVDVDDVEGGGAAASGPAHAASERSTARNAARTEGKLERAGPRPVRGVGERTRTSTPLKGTRPST
jgi:hypothetical protein